MSRADRFIEQGCIACGEVFATYDLTLAAGGLCSSCLREEDRPTERMDKMESKALAVAPAPQPLHAIEDEAMWQLIASGDLTALTAKQKTEYYLHLCTSLGMNPATQPFEYLRLNNKLILYAKKAATDQLRDIRGVSIEGLPRITDDGEYITAEVMVRDREGRTDFDIGAVHVGAIKGEARANARMKALTKAKRRATLSVCGLGMLDETEVEGIPGVRAVAPMRRMIEPEDVSQEPERTSVEEMEEALPDPPVELPVVTAFAALGVTKKQLEDYLARDLNPDTVVPDAERADLKRIYESLKGKRASWADVVAASKTHDAAAV